MILVCLHVHKMKKKRVHFLPSSIPVKFLLEFHPDPSQLSLVMIYSVSQSVGFLPQGHSMANGSEYDSNLFVVKELEVDDTGEVDDSGEVDDTDGSLSRVKIWHIPECFLIDRRLLYPMVTDY